VKSIVIITHRYHYHICQVAIQLALKQFNPNSIAILFDDVTGTQAGWDDTGKELTRAVKMRNLRSSTNIFSMAFSALPNIHNESSGWIRQQYVKLNLHKLLSGDEWLVIDGDVLINQPIDPWTYCYINTADKFRSHHDWFTRYTLNLHNQRSFFEGREVEFSSVPIRLLTRKTLEGLEQHVHKLHNTDIRGVRDSFTLKTDRDFYLELSEYDLIANYQYFISNDIQKIKPLEIYFEPAEKLYAKWDFLKNKIAVLHGWDNLPLEWYQKFGIEINQKIWDLLYTSQN
jgi:hypothetical protein